MYGKEINQTIKENKNEWVNQTCYYLIRNKLNKLFVH